MRPLASRKRYHVSFAAGRRAVVRIVFPEVCAGCGVSGTWMCDACRAECTRIDPTEACNRCGDFVGTHVPRCRRCMAWPDAIQSCRATFTFSGPIRLAIHRLKYQGERSRAVWCAEQMAISGARFIDGSDALIPVPLHPRRRKRRGYNQSQLLAQELGKLVNLPIRDGIVRRRETASQVGLTAEARLVNVSGAFAATESLLGLRVVLIDDVITTGATLNECARAALVAGAASVRALVLASDVASELVHAS